MSHHSHSSSISQKKLHLTILLNFGITAIQVVGGILSGSLALLSDALHNLSDGVALLLAYIALKISYKPRTKSKTFGYKRASILAALINAVVLIGVSLFLIFEAIERFMHPHPIQGGLMFWMGIIGLLGNSFSVVLLQREKEKSINLKAAYLHLLGDALTSLAVIAGAGAIYYLEWTWVDPLITILISIYLIVHTWDILIESLEIIMQFVPRNIDLEEVRDELEKYEEVHNIHHMHLWRLTDKEVHFEAHVELNKDLPVSKTSPLFHKMEKELLNSFGITHLTLQWEYASGHTKTIPGDKSA